MVVGSHFFYHTTWADSVAKLFKIINGPLASTFDMLS